MLHKFSYILIVLLVFHTTLSLRISHHAITETITPDVMDNLITIVDRYFFNSDATDPIPIKKFLRAAFHDCMGGCDASINLFHSENRGLEGLVGTLNKTYSSKSDNFSYISTYLSRADFLVLAQQRALGLAWKAGGQVPTFTNSTPSFIYRRQSNPIGVNNDDIEGNFPDGRANWTLPSSDTNHPTTILEGLLAGLPGISQSDIVILLGLHGAGTLNMNNSGFDGPWLQGKTLLNTVSNQFYKSLFSVGYPKGSMQQLSSSENTVKASNSEFEYFSDQPEKNKIQWFGKGGTKAKSYINADVSIYYNFTSSQNGTATGKYCPQGSNTTLFDCNAKDSSYMALSNNAQQGFKYATDNLAYLNDLLPAFLRLVNVTNEFTTSSNLKGFYPQLACVNGQQVCKGDIFLIGCGVTLGSC